MNENFKAVGPEGSTMNTPHPYKPYKTMFSEHNANSKLPRGQNFALAIMTF